MKRILLLLLLIIGFTGCQNLTSDSNNPINQNSNTTYEVDENQPEESLSLELLRQKNFDGRDLKLGRILEETNVYTRYYITYRSGELTISGIMNIPKGAGPFPILILNHGYIDPAIYTNGRGLRREQDYFARNGYAVVHPDYRNHADSSKDEDTEYNFRLGYAEDVINAVLAVKASDLPNLDKEKIGMLGHSMGGGITMNVIVTQPELVQAASLYAPVSANVVDNFERWTRTRPETAARIIDEYGEPDENPEFYAQLSPINYLNQIQTPIILHHGTSDADVPIAWSEHLYQELNKANKNISYHVYPDGPHEFIDDWSLFMQRNLDFFDEHLRGE